MNAVPVNSSLIIGIGAFLIVAIFLLIKWILSAITGHVLFNAFLTWYRRRKRNRAMKSSQSHDKIDLIE